MTKHRTKDAEHIGDVAKKALGKLKIVPDSEFKEEGISSMDKEVAYSTLSRVPVKFRKSKYTDFRDEDAAVTVAKLYAENVKGWLFLYGQSGSGKTMLASVVSRHVIMKHFMPVEWMNAVEIMNELKSTWGNRNKGSLSENEIISKYTRPGLLVIDDLGAEGEDEHAIKTMYMILNKRSERVLPTVFTSNLGLNDIKQVSVRIADRILRETEGRRIKMDNGSFYYRKNL